jgi:hypothetical protein
MSQSTISQFCQNSEKSSLENFIFTIQNLKNSGASRSLLCPLDPHQSITLNLLEASRQPPNPCLKLAYTSNDRNIRPLGVLPCSCSYSRPVEILFGFCLLEILIKFSYEKLMTKDSVVLIWGVEIYIDCNIMTIQLLFLKKGQTKEI